MQILNFRSRLNGFKSGLSQPCPGFVLGVSNPGRDCFEVSRPSAPRFGHQLLTPTQLYQKIKLCRGNWGDDVSPYMLAKSQEKVCAILNQHVWETQRDPLTGLTLLLTVVKNGNVHRSVVDLLIGEGASLLDRDPEGKTILHLASVSALHDEGRALRHILTRYGSQVGINTIDKNGNTPLDDAMALYDEVLSEQVPKVRSITKTLRKHDAKTSRELNEQLRLMAGF